MTRGSEARRNVARIAFWVAVALVFGVWIAVTRGRTAAAEYYAAYLVEESLSIDNIFVFAIIFSQLHIPPRFQRRVLRWGVAGALVFRGLMIGTGIALLQRFEWILYPFAALILFAAWRMLFAKEQERRVVEQACDVCSTWIARVVPVTPVIAGPAFWRRENGRGVATPLLVALVLIETTDLVFALDSIPAVLAISRDPLIVYSSNVLAMVGLRSMYFVVSDALDGVAYLRQGLAAVLVFTGAKMLAAPWVHVGPGASVAVIAGILLLTVWASAPWRPRAARSSPPR
jgi:TerC family integral membrane protein